MKKQRNRAAAQKCRDKKQRETFELEEVVKKLRKKRNELKERNEQLTKELRILQFQTMNQSAVAASGYHVENQLQPLNLSLNPSTSSPSDQSFNFWE